VKRSAIITVAALLILAVGLAQRSHHKREFTTTSAEAYKLYVAGDEALNSFQYREAGDALQRALELDPSFAMAQAALAELYLTERPDSAPKAYARADSLAALLPDENERLLVQLRVARGQDAVARRDSLLTLLDQRLPRHPIVLTTHAMIATNAQEGEQAEKLWKDILEEDPNYARAYNWLGYNAAYMGRFDEALKYLKKYAYLAPNLANPHDSLGEILSLMGRYEDAEREFRAALAIQPDFSHSIIYLAMTYLMRGRVAKGVDIMEKLRGEVAGTGFEYLIDELLIRFYYEHQMFDRLHAALIAYERRYPEGRHTSYYRSYRLLMDGRLKEAEALHDSLVAARHAQYKESSAPAISESVIRIEESFRGTGHDSQGPPGRGRALAHRGGKREDRATRRSLQRPVLLRHGPLRRRSQRGRAGAGALDPGDQSALPAGPDAAGPGAGGPGALAGRPHRHGGADDGPGPGGSGLPLRRRERQSRQPRAAAEQLLRRSIRPCRPLSGPRFAFYTERTARNQHAR
jgi:tetratricopeptide (TPR) repeat protein